MMQNWPLYNRSCIGQKLGKPTRAIYDGFPTQAVEHEQMRQSIACVTLRPLVAPPSDKSTMNERTENPRISTREKERNRDDDGERV